MILIFDATPTLLMHVQLPYGLPQNVIKNPQHPVSTYNFRLQRAESTPSARAEILHTGGDEKPDINFAWPNEMDISSGDEMLSQAAYFDAVESSAEEVS